MPNTYIEDSYDVRMSDGAFAALDLNFKANVLYTGRLRSVLQTALNDMSGVYARPSAVSQQDATKLLVSYPAETPAILYGYTPALTVRGMSFERPSYNQVITSTGTSMFSTGSNVTSAAATKLGPDGTASMVTVTQTAAAGYSQSANISLPADSSVWTFSAIVPKQAASQRIELNVQLSGGTGAAYRLVIDPSGIVGPTDLGTTLRYGIEDRGDWLLIWGSVNIGTNSTAQMRYLPTFSGSGLTGSGDVGFLQLEPGYGASSRIKTTGTAGVRRERDSIAIPVPSLAGAGTIEVTASPNDGAIARVLAQVDDGTANNRVTVQRSAAGNIQAVFVAAGVTTATLDLGAHTARTETRVAVGWGGGKVRVIRDGAGLAEASIATPPGLKTLRLGGDTATTSLDGPLARISAWPGLRTDLFYETPSASLYPQGDSMAAGSGSVSPPGDTWWGVLAGNLKRTIVNAGSPGTTSSQALTAELADTTHRNWVHLIFTGHNGANATQTVADITAIVAHLSPDPLRRRFLIGLPGQNTANPPGSAGYQAIVDTRAAIIAAFPDNYVDLPGALLAAALALGDTAQSDSNIANGFIPARYMADMIHWNVAGQAVEEQAWRAKILAKGW